MKNVIKSIVLLTLAISAFAIDLDGSIEVVGKGSAFELRYVELGGVRYTTTDELAKISENRFYSAIKRKESLSIGGESYIFSPDNRFVVVAECTFDMGIETRVASDAMLIPLRPILDIMAIRKKMSIDYRDGKAVFVERAKSSASETRIPTPKPAVADTKTVSAPKDTVNATPKKKKWAVMIDPGHGGKDPGASAKDGVHEKTIVLDIAKKLREILEKDTLFTVMATRSEDKFLPLGERTALANSKGADLFVSIHCNAAHNKSARGTQVFFLAPARSDQARATAALENASIFLEEPSDSANDTDFIMADLIQNEFLRESSRLAVLIEESISKQTGLPERGPAGAGFYVLKGSFMPAVLVESAFLSNPDDAALLEKESFRKKVADGIADGLRRFITELPK